MRPAARGGVWGWNTKLSRDNFHDVFLEIIRVFVFHRQNGFVFHFNGNVTSEGRVQLNDIDFIHIERGFQFFEINEIV